MSSGAGFGTESGLAVVSVQVVVFTESPYLVVHEMQVHEPRLNKLLRK